MLARDIMTTPVLTVSPDTDVQAIAGLLLECRISALPVVDDDGELRGIVSEGDLITRLDVAVELFGVELVGVNGEAKSV